MGAPVVGFVGLGAMGGALAANVVGAGLDLVGYDAAGPERVPSGGRAAADLAEVAASADVVVLSLPDGAVAGAVARDLAAAASAPRSGRSDGGAGSGAGGRPDGGGHAGGRVTHVVDTSTVGVTAARRIADLLATHGVGYVDAPVSGGVDGARARTLAVMYAGSDEACAAVEPVLAALSDRRYRVGDTPGLAQGLKLANNFLSATALAATSEAVAFGQSLGLDMATMLRVIDAASGRSAATADKFPRHVLTGRYASGFTNSLMAKDVGLYLAAVRDGGGPTELGAVTAAVWQRFAEGEPGADFTRIYPFVAGD